MFKNLQLLQSGTIALALVFAGMGSFEMIEPTVTRGATNTFAVQQTISAELSFLATSSAVSMVGSLAGITGGNATATTQVVVQTNSAGGYNMTLVFSGTPAMRGNATGNTSLVNYGTTSEPTYNLVASSSAIFAYTVNASTTSDLDQSFKSNGSNTCNTGSTVVANTCWMGPSTTAMMIVNRLAAATTSATTTLTFRVSVPNNPFPALQSDTYTATATLTATAQ